MTKCATKQDVKDAIDDAVQENNKVIAAMINKAIDNAVDALVGVRSQYAEITDNKLLLLQAKIDKHDRWIKQLARHQGIKLI